MRAEQAILFEEREDCISVRSLLSTKLKRRALNEPLLPQRGSLDPISAARTNQERGGGSSVLSGRVWPLYRGV